MNRIDSSLITPIYVKQSKDMSLPTDPVYYLLAANNLYLCRNHPFFQSCVPASRWPTELAPHAESLISNYPPVPREVFEQICGFFGYITDRYGAEAIALLVWDRVNREVRTIVPPQVSAVSRGKWGGVFPIGVKYRFPRDLPQHWTVFGDVHSHCEMRAYASQTDIQDEDSLTGLHIVVGCLHQEPPEFHAEVVVDGTRFAFEWQDVVSGYQRRASFPAEWPDQVAVTNFAAFHAFDFDADELKRAASPEIRTVKTKPSRHD